MANNTRREVLMRRLLAGALGVALVFGGDVAPARAQDAKDTERFSEKQSADLQELLTTGLRARSKSDKAYIAKVVKKVEEGDLSEKLVKAVFNRARAQHSRYPLPYFTAILKQVARQRGVTI
jgi:hypothetical protein